MSTDHRARKTQKCSVSRFQISTDYLRAYFSTGKRNQQHKLPDYCFYEPPVRTRTRARKFEFGRLLEALLLGRLLKSEDNLSEVLVRSMAFLVGSEEATFLDYWWWQ